MKGATALKQLGSPQEETGGTPRADSPQMPSLVYLLRALVKFNASDLHIKVGRPPIYRVHGKLVSAKMSEITRDIAEALLIPSLNSRQAQDLDKNRQVDFSFAAEGLGRFRCNIFFQRGLLSAAIRMISSDPPEFDSLSLPTVIKDLCMRPRGLLLLTGATGSGKSTTLAAVINYINQQRECHILTIEDPIEFVFRDRKASITQREVGSDCLSFQSGLVSGLRQDPDVIVIGEIRDRDTLQVALTAAETGHLVMSTLHTRDAKSTIDRILDIFPTDAQTQVRIQLASSLLGVVSQRLIARADGNGRVPACEVMVNSPTVEGCILKDEREHLSDVIASSAAYYRMQTFNQCLAKLVASGLITREEAVRNSPRPDDLAMGFAGIVREKTQAVEAHRAHEGESSVQVEELELEG